MACQCRRKNIGSLVEIGIPMFSDNEPVVVFPLALRAKKWQVVELPHYMQETQKAATSNS